VAIQFICDLGYFLDSHSFTFSGSIIDSTKVYDPDFSLFTILMALVNRFDEVCKVATVFFAMSI
jgi:hypothetical protein